MSRLRDDLTWLAEVEAEAAARALLNRDAPEDDLPPADADEFGQPIARHVTLAGVDEETFKDLSNELSTVPGLYAEVLRVLIERRGMNSLSRRNRR